MGFLFLATWKKIFLLRCLLVVATVRIGLSVINFNRLRKFTLAPSATGRVDIDYLKRVSWGISRASAHVPGATCLTQALAGQFLLSRRGIASTIRFGVDRRSHKELRAHAWLISGGYVVLGGQAHDMGQFSHLADFGTAP